MISVEVRARGENNADDVRAVTSTCKRLVSIPIVERLIGIDFHDSPNRGLSRQMEEYSDGGV